MKLLFISQYFYPEEFRGNDIAFDWAKRGHEVTVITAIPNYPLGRFYPGYGMFKRRKEIVNGVSVVRIPVIPRGKGKGLMLLLNYFSFAFLASSYVLLLLVKQSYDLVFVQQLSPVTMALPGVLIKKVKRIPMVMWVLDLWPESLVSAGKVNNRFVVGFFDRIVKFIYNNSDRILISSKGFKNSICSKGNFEQKIEYLPNWAEETFSQSEFNMTMPEMPEMPEGFIVMFAGNIGEAQDFENVMNAALMLREHSYIKFVILGEGRKKKWIEDFCKKNSIEDKVFLLGRFPIALMPAFFKKANLMLVSLKDENVFNFTLPAKVQAYMASGKPIVGMMNGDGYDTIKLSNCGVCVNSSDYNGLANEILKLSRKNICELNQLGINGYNYAKQHFDKNTLLDDLHTRHIINLVNCKNEGVK